jgi:hypothetical protein
MQSTFQEQLSVLPIPRVTTILRVDLPILPSDSALQMTGKIITDWWNKKAEAYGLEIRDEDSDLSLSKGKFKLEFARLEGVLGLSMEEPDSRPELEREWICDIGLRENGGIPQFELRLSYRQPQSIAQRPEPRAPRLLRELLARVGALDIQRLEQGFSLVDSHDVDGFVELLRNKNRRLPVIAISEESSGTLSIDPGKFAKVLAGAAHAVQLTTSASWEISRLIGQEWSVFQGAVRCYNPNLEWTDDKFRHKLWLARDIKRIDASN